jgi:molybdopterin synthase sulfur carrier subunit
MLTVKFFARLREALGPQTQWPYRPGLTVGGLRDALVAQGGAHAEALARSQFLRAARNQRMVDEGEPLADGDEVAFFPPVTGG